MRRGVSSVRGFGVVAVVVVVVVVVVGVLALVALFLGYAMAAGDRELPSTLVRYVLAPLVSLSLGGGAVAAVVRWLLAQREAGRVPELGEAPAGPASSGDVPMPDRSRAEADPPRRVRGSQAPRQLPTSTPGPRDRARDAEHKRRG